ncbi:MAG: type II secretion system protein GspH [Halomonadaceae bacterium]|nr:MAG: type II secretion system protein GspH [Halomonadaceae bacterium]
MIMNMSAPAPVAPMTCFPWVLMAAPVVKATMLKSVSGISTRSKPMAPGHTYSLGFTLQRGFTLIEMMVVLIVIGLLVSLVGLNMGGGGERRQLEERTRDLYLKMQAASDEAVISNREIGLVFDDERYFFIVYSMEEDRWEQRQDRRLPPGSLPQWINLDLQTEGAEEALPVGDDDEDLIPSLVFFSSGEVTPFDLELRYEDQADSAHYLVSDGINPLQWFRPGDDSRPGF